MNVIQWTIEQIEKDSECCGNPLRCHREYMDGIKVFRSCVGIAEEDVLEK